MRLKIVIEDSDAGYPNKCNIYLDDALINDQNAFTWKVTKSKAAFDGGLFLDSNIFRRGKGGTAWVKVDFGHVLDPYIYVHAGDLVEELQKRANAVNRAFVNKYPASYPNNASTELTEP